MTDDISTASTSELAEFNRHALARLMDPLAQLTAAEKQSLTMSRVAAVAELNKREAESKAAAKHDAAKQRLDEIEREVLLHNAMIKGADSPELSESERAVRRHRLDALTNEAALLQRSVAE